MIEKYHKEIGFKACHVKEALLLIEALQGQRLSFSKHSLYELSRETNCVEIGQFLRDYRLNFDDCFEIALFKGIIQKLGFRVNFNEKDVIFIISRENTIVTLWTNNKDDKHYTLRKENYSLIS